VSASADLSISLCLVVRDEDALLPGCLLAAAPVADELVVVDTGSTDATAAIAESFGARVLHVPWTDSFSAARNAALDAARGDWVVFPDADEHLEPGGAARLRATIAGAACEGLALPLTNLTGDGSTSAVSLTLRAWRHRPGRRFEGRVHERLAGLPAAGIGVADVSAVHHGYLDARWDGRGKTARNLALLAQEPPTPFTAFNLGSEHARAGDWEPAATHFDAALAALGSEWPHVPYGPLLAGRAARARRGCGRLAEARELLAAAIPRVPAYTDLVFELACCAVAAGDVDDAAVLLRRCLDQGDAPPPYLATAGAGSHLARALLDRITLPG
jgi:glycosyltransferase involved in cell wall biosynthesis